MTSELERCKDALRMALRFIGGYGEQKTVVDAIDAILNPPPIMEDVEEIVGWVNVYPDGQGGYTVCSHDTKEAADNNAGSDRAFCQPIRVTVKREKKRPVERSVTVEAHIIDSPAWAAGDAEGPDCPNPFHAHPECHGKSGKLTFTYTEDPTT